MITLKELIVVIVYTAGLYTALEMIYNDYKRGNKK